MASRKDKFKGQGRRSKGKDKPKDKGKVTGKLSKEKGGISCSHDGSGARLKKADCRALAKEEFQTKGEEGTAASAGSAGHSTNAFGWAMTTGSWADAAQEMDRECSERWVMVVNRANQNKRQSGDSGRTLANVPEVMLTQFPAKGASISQRESLGVGLNKRQATATCGQRPSF